MSSFCLDSHARVRHKLFSVAIYLQGFLFLLNSIVSLGIFTASAMALIAHKITIILLHRPLPTIGLIFFGPFLFAFDIISLMLLHRGLASAVRAWNILARLLCVLITCCSAAFVSLYLETNTPLNWGQTVEVPHHLIRVDIQIVSEWKMYSKFVGQGGGRFGYILIIYISTGLAAMFARRGLEGNYKREAESEIQDTIEPRKRIFRKFLRTPFVRLTAFLFIGSLFLPGQPWKSMRTTLLVDVIHTVSSAAVTKSLGNLRGDCSGATLGSNPLGSLNYSPANDPYYVSNLDSPIDDFIETALEGTEFTNIVHIVLESMRADCYPFEEDSQLMTYITNNLQFLPNGRPITTSNISPFIASLAKHTISWETMWTLAPFTHKAMVGRTSNL